MSLEVVNNPEQIVPEGKQYTFVSDQRVLAIFCKVCAFAKVAYTLREIARELPATVPLNSDYKFCWQRLTQCSKFGREVLMISKHFWEGCPLTHTGETFLQCLWLHEATDCFKNYQRFISIHTISIPSQSRATVLSDILPKYTVLRIGRLKHDILKSSWFVYFCLKRWSKYLVR